MLCPECNTKAKIIRTDPINAYLRKLTHVCNSDDCKMLFITQEEYIKTLEQPLHNDKAIHPK